MDTETALKFIAHLIQQKTGKALNHLELATFRGSWDDLSYKQIAKKIGANTGYLETNIGPKLWKKISLVLGQTVGKKNFKIPIELAWEHYQLNTHALVNDNNFKTISDKVLSHSENNTQAISKDILANILNYSSESTAEFSSIQESSFLFKCMMLFLLIIRLLSFWTLFPKLDDFFKDLAVDYQRNNQLFKSFIFYHLTKIANPQHSVHYALGSLYEAMNMLPMAEKEYTIAIEEKQQPYAYNNLARLYIFESQLEEAIQLLNTGLELAENDEYVYIFYKNLGMAYLLLQEYQMSIVYLQKSIEIAPERSSVAYGLMARIMEKLGKFPEAEELWAKFRKYAINDHSPDVNLLKLC